ncbi:MAG TPA: aspartate kinase [Gammaproteobacteria bacterium]|nr:aspartate kinase [Gammaproteobacteria bacterium]
MPARKDWVVLKFGGTSVASVERWQTIADAIERCAAGGERVMVVCSALSGVSNLLQELIDAVSAGRDTTTTLAEIRRKHEELADAMGLSADDEFGEELAELERMVEGARLIGAVPDEVHARIMAMGELMSTRLGAAWLRTRGTSVAWRDARSLLLAEPASASAGSSHHYLSATCHYAPDDRLLDDLAELSENAVLTQGFIAADRHGDTVLLGRGGSDTSAAYLAGKLNAKRLEIWTDVPGLFTANPKHRADARLLRAVTFEEAQVLAAMGARVLHPRCIPPVRDNDIPLHMRCTQAPEMEGTVVSRAAASTEPGVKAVVSRHHLYLIRIDCPGHWHLAGTLAEVTAVFGRNGIAIDLIANSAASITLTIDPAASPLSEQDIAHLVGNLESIGTANVSYEVGSVSLVGSNIASVMSRLSPALKPLEAQRIHLVSDAGPDDALSFVLEPEDVDYLMNPLHDWLMAQPQPETTFGPAWWELSNQFNRR